MGKVSERDGQTLSWTHRVDVVVTMLNVWCHTTKQVVEFRYGHSKVTVVALGI